MVYGFVVDGTHYRGGCETRHGPYPFCDELALPSYSTAKSIFAGVALMRMEKRHPGIAAQSVASLIPECPPERWSDVIVEPIWSRLNLSPLLDDAKRTYDEAAQPFAGYGLTYEADDIVRIAQWLSQDNAEIAGKPVLEEGMLTAALQRDPDDRGLATSVPNLIYNNGFWGFNAADTLGCDQDLWVPFMSAYGGIAIAMLPNDTVYYYFSDGYVHHWALAAAESNKIRKLCR